MESANFLLFLLVQEHRTRCRATTLRLQDTKRRVFQ